MGMKQTESQCQLHITTLITIITKTANTYIRLCARHSSKGFMCMNSLNCHNSDVRYYLPCFRGKETEAQRFSDLPKVMQLAPRQPLFRMPRLDTSLHETASRYTHSVSVFHCYRTAPKLMALKNHYFPCS